MATTVETPGTPEDIKAIRAHYQPIVTELVETWATGRPPLPATGKPSGYYRMTAFLLEYLCSNHAFPTGIHNMPEGRDSNNKIEPSFPVDFDLLAAGKHLHCFSEPRKPNHP